MECQWCKIPLMILMYWSYCLGWRLIWATRACQDSFAPASHSWPRMPRWCLSTWAHRAVGTSCWSLMKPYTILPGPWCCLCALLYHFDFNIFKGLNWYHGYIYIYIYMDIWILLDRDISPESCFSQDMMHFHLSKCKGISQMGLTLWAVRTVKLWSVQRTWTQVHWKKKTWHRTRSVTWCAMPVFRIFWCDWWDFFPIFHFWRFCIIWYSLYILLFLHFLWILPNLWSQV